MFSSFFLFGQIFCHNSPFPSSKTAKVDNFKCFITQNNWVIIQKKTQKIGIRRRIKLKLELFHWNIILPNKQYGMFGLEMWACQASKHQFYQTFIRSFFCRVLLGTLFSFIWMFLPWKFFPKQFSFDQFQKSGPVARRPPRPHETVSLCFKIQLCNLGLKLVLFFKKK